MSATATAEKAISREQLEDQLAMLTEPEDYKQRIDNANLLANILVELEKNIQIDPSYWDQATKLAFSVAEHAKEELVRKPYGEANVIANFSRLFTLQSAPQEFQVQSLRVFGNLCFDEDENRKRVLDANIIPATLSLLEKDVNTLNKIACGFFLNTSMDYEPVQIAIAQHGGISVISALLTPEKLETDPDCVYLAINALNNIISPELAEKQFTAKDTTHILNLTTFLCQTFKKNGDLSSFREEPSTTLSMLNALTEMLFSIVADNDEMASCIIENSDMNALLDFVEEATYDEDNAKDFQKVKETLSHVIVHSFGADKQMESLFRSEALVARLIRATGAKDDIVIQTAFGAIGNLARSDKHCIELVNRYHLEKQSLDGLQGTEHGVSQHVILSCLKQICLPEENRKIIGEAGAIEIVSSFLDDSKDLLKANQFSTIGILRNLCDKNYYNAERIIQGGDQSILNSILAFIERVDDIAAMSEATRVLMNLVKTVWKEDGENTEKLRGQLTRKEVAAAIIGLIRVTAFPVLKNDGAIAMTLLLTSTDSTSLSYALSAINSPVSDAGEEKRTFLQVVIDDVCSDTLPEQTRCNMCTLLESILKASQTVARCQQDSTGIVGRNKATATISEVDVANCNIDDGDLPELEKRDWVDRLLSLDEKTMVGTFARRVVDLIHQESDAANKEPAI